MELPLRNYYLNYNIPNIITTVNIENSKLTFGITYTNNFNTTGYFIGILRHDGTNVRLFMFTPNYVIKHCKWFNLETDDIHTVLNGLKYLLYTKITEDHNHNYTLERTNVINQQLCNNEYHTIRDIFNNNPDMHYSDSNRIQYILSSHPTFPQFMEEDAYLINLYEYTNNINQVMYQEIDDDIDVNQPVVITIPQELQHHFIDTINTINNYSNYDIEYVTDENNINYGININNTENEYNYLNYQDDLESLESVESADDLESLDSETDFNSDTTNNCPVCYINSKSHVIVPCGHLYCESCINTLNTCAICRGPINMRLKTY